MVCFRENWSCSGKRCTRLGGYILCPYVRCKIAFSQSRLSCTPRRKRRDVWSKLQLVLLLRLADNRSHASEILSTTLLYRKNTNTCMALCGLVPPRLCILCIFFGLTILRSKIHHPPSPVAPDPRRHPLEVPNLDFDTNRGPSASCCVLHSP